MKFIPYLCCGDPSASFTIKAAIALAPYSYLIELGIPFSDPIADGPAIQEASQRALSNGGGIRQAMQIAHKISSCTNVPLAFMTYYNPIFSYGKEKFISDSKKCGISALIVPDLPFGEDPSFSDALKKSNMGLIGMVSLSTYVRRAKKIINSSHPFTYIVSVSGTTGERKSILKDSLLFVKKIRSVAGKKKELFVGFGVSSPSHALEFLKHGASGVIVGSKLISLYTKYLNSGSEDLAIRKLVSFSRSFAEI
ncbi:MAG: tryptophan synthase subunit alpha [Candidatus Anstonellales archaeon]